MNFDPGFPIAVKTNPMGFAYGEGVSGSVPELRTLDRIRKSLMAPICTGPEIVYCIAMDVALETDNPDLEQRNLLYGAVTDAAATPETATRFTAAQVTSLSCLPAESMRQSTPVRRDR